MSPSAPEIPWKEIFLLGIFFEAGDIQGRDTTHSRPVVPRLHRVRRGSPRPRGRPPRRRRDARPSEIGPYLPGAGFRSADATLSGGYAFAGRARLFAYGQLGVLLGPTVDSPLVKTRRTYLVGAGVSVAVF